MKQLKDYLDIEMVLDSGNPKNIYTVFKLLLNNTPPATPYISIEGINPMLKQLLIDNANDINTEYETNRFEKIISPSYQKLIDSQTITGANIILGKLILNKFYDKWNRIADALFSDYNPINNYDMVESESGGKNIKVNTDMNTEEHETNSYSGFDSDGFKDTTKSDKSGSTTGTKAKNEQAEISNRSLTRKGNIGVTTSQQMIESEIKLREHNLLNIIYDDIDSILFLDYYC